MCIKEVWFNDYKACSLFFSMIIIFQSSRLRRASHCIIIFEIIHSTRGFNRDKMRKIVFSSSNRNLGKSGQNGSHCIVAEFTFSTYFLVTSEANELSRSATILIVFLSSAISPCTSILINLLRLP